MGFEANIEDGSVRSEGGNTSFLKTVFNGLNGIIGIGILSMPYALASGGWLSLIFLLVIAVAAFYSGILTKRCMEVNNKIKTYADIGEFSFGNVGKLVISVVLYIDLYLVSTGILILEGDNLHNLFPGMQINLHGLAIGGKQSLVIIVALALLPTVWLEDLSVIAYLSAVGVVAYGVILASVTSVGAFGNVGFHNKGEVLNWKGIPSAISLYMFSLSANPLFPTLYTSMKKKGHFSKVLLIGFLCASLCYTSMAVIGYLMFGSSLQSQITLNLPTQKLSSKIAIYVAWIIPLTKYALIIEPVAAATQSWFPKYQTKRWLKILVRTTLVATQVVVALSIPFFGSLMSLVGALLGAPASITIPCICYLKISKAKRISVEMVFIILLILLSLLIVIFGTWTSVRDIIKQTIRHH